ncbi:MAG: LemA family protein [Actinomycetota bacterium]|nr:LemA family protein [Actinomycetota bacterium]MCL6093963.1 LemA family protein [Actinomycetota bacterium]MDA8167623.1 LemA family protein [Actinomycetota bacterium]
MIAWLIIIAVIAVLIIALAAAYNGLVRSRNKVNNSWKQIDVQLKRRHDLIPNLVEMVKDYMSYEQEVLQNVTKARSEAMQAQGPADSAKAENVLSGALKSLFAVAENYPDLKANQNVSQLQEELTSTENKIAFARQLYNDLVMDFNNKVQTFPSNVVAGAFGFKAREYFEVPEEEKEPVKVNLR